MNTISVNKSNGSRNNKVYQTCNKGELERVQVGREKKPIRGRLCRRIHTLSTQLLTQRRRSPPRSRKVIIIDGTQCDHHKSYHRLLGHAIRKFLENTTLKLLLCCSSSISSLNWKLEDYWKTQHVVMVEAGGVGTTE